MEIEKMIPLPSPAYGKGKKVSEENKPLYALIGKMEVGDSFLCPAQYMTEKGTFYLKTRLEKKYGIRLCQRKVEDGIRIWRTE